MASQAATMKNQKQHQKTEEKRDCVLDLKPNSPAPYFPASCGTMITKLGTWELWVQATGVCQTWLSGGRWTPARGISRFAASDQVAPGARQRLAGLWRRGLGGRRSGERGLLGLAVSYLYVLLLGFVLHGLLFTGPGLFSRGRGETGTGSAGTSPPPPYPTGTSFSRFSSPRGLKCYRPVP
jgi:hypothetical protein